MKRQPQTNPDPRRTSQLVPQKPSPQKPSPQKLAKGRVATAAGLALIVTLALGPLVSLVDGLPGLDSSLWAAPQEEAAPGGIQDGAQEEEATDDAAAAAAEGEAEDERTGASEAAPSGVRVVSGTIDGEINNVASAYVTRLVADVEAKNADALFLELNTFGGRVDAAVAIRDALIDLEIPVIVYINKRAISAGALISLACDKIVMAPGGTIGAATPVMAGPGQEVPEAVEEKYLSYFREEMRSTAESSGRDPDVAEAMVDKDKVIEGLSEEGKLLTLTTKKALEIGFADLEASSAAEALAALGYPEQTEELERSWSEELVGFLTSQAIASFLFLAMVVFAYMEYQTPGFGLFGGGAILCFLILFFSHYLVNLAGWEELILFAAGILLIILEVFVIPGFGIAGIAGIFCLLASGVLMLLAGDWSDFSFTNPFTLDAVQRVTLSTLLGCGVLILLLRLLPQRNLGPSKHLMLGTTLGGDAGYHSFEGGNGNDESLVGTTGEALTTLRPSGRARIGGVRMEVEAQGEFIDKGEAVRVVKKAGGRVIVRRA